MLEKLKQARIEIKAVLTDEIKKFAQVMREHGWFHGKDVKVKDALFAMPRQPKLIPETTSLNILKNRMVRDDYVSRSSVAWWTYLKFLDVSKTEPHLSHFGWHGDNKIFKAEVENQKKFFNGIPSKEAYFAGHQLGVEVLKRQIAQETGKPVPAPRVKKEN